MTGISTITGNSWFGYIFPAHIDSHCLSTSPSEVKDDMVQDPSAGIVVITGEVFTDMTSVNISNSPVIAQSSLFHDEIEGDAWCSTYQTNPAPGVHFPTPFVWPTSCSLVWGSGLTTLPFEPAILTGCSDSATVITYWLKPEGAIETSLWVSVDSVNHMIHLDPQPNTFNNQ